MEGDTGRGAQERWPGRPGGEGTGQSGGVWLQERCEATGEGVSRGFHTGEWGRVGRPGMGALRPGEVEGEGL